MDELLLLVHSVQRTWARFRKLYCCWGLICVWRKWRERRGRNHPTGRKRPVEVMAGVEVEGLGSCLIAVCSTHTHTHTHTHTSEHTDSFTVHRFSFPSACEWERGTSRCQSMHAPTPTEEVDLKHFYYMQQCCSAYRSSAKCAVSHCSTSTSYCTSAWVGESVAVESFTAPEAKMKCSILWASIGFWCVGEFG